MNQPNNGDVVYEEEMYSHAMANVNDEDFRDYNNRIKIHIHAAPNSETASEGCQNIPIPLYIQFLDNINGSNQKNMISYMLLDASKIKSAEHYDIIDKMQLIISMFSDNK